MVHSWAEAYSRENGSDKLNLKAFCASFELGVGMNLITGDKGYHSFSVYHSVCAILKYIVLPISPTKMQYQLPGSP